MTFYCAEKAKGHDCLCTSPPIGLPQCHYCYHYQRGNVEPTSPLPVKTNNETTIYAEWFGNDDGYWNWVRANEGGSYD